MVEGGEGGGGGSDAGKAGGGGRRAVEGRRCVGGPGDVDGVGPDRRRMHPAHPAWSPTLVCVSS